MRDLQAVLGELTSLGRALTGALKRESVAERTAECLARLFEPARVAVALAPMPGAADAVLATLGEPTPPADDPFLTELQRQGCLIRDPRHGRLGAPLVAAGHTMGCLAVWSKSPGAFDAPECEVVTTAVASQAALALQNARLIDLLSTGKREWEQMVDGISPGICIVDAHGQVRRANRSFATLVGAPVTALAGRHWLMLLPPAWADSVGRVLKTPGVETAEIRADRRIYSVGAHAIRGADDDTVVLLIEDVTETRRLQEQLIQSEKLSAIGQLIAGVAHELNNPLASVLGFADFLAEASSVPSHLAEPLRVIQQEAQRAAGIVKNLLTFARRQEQERRRLAVGPVLERTVQLINNQLLALKVEPLLVVEPGLPDIEGNQNQLQQVFLNVINNAAQAIASTGRGGTVAIRARPWLDGIAVDVTDNGPGIPEELQGKIFEPFFTTKAEGQGTGLGLSICLGIVKEHGGNLTMRSTPGHGATFTIELPASGLPEEPARSSGEHAALTGRILVVDDEPHILHYMRATLESWGHEVETAGDGQEALRRAMEERFDLIITDVRMPRLGGRELFERLRESRPEAAARVVFATGDSVRDDTLAFLEGSGRPFLHKPFKLAELRRTIAAALEKTP
jgi:two-component system NtrC family sensor kinase